MIEVKLAVVTLTGVGRGVRVTCPWCDKVTPRANSYFGSGKHTFRCSHCHRPYRVRFAGEKKKRGE